MTQPPDEIFVTMIPGGRGFWIERAETEATIRYVRAGAILERVRLLVIWSAAIAVGLASWYLLWLAFRAIFLG